MKPPFPIRAAAPLWRDALPPIAILLGGVFLAVQLPRRALFYRPRVHRAPQPEVSFITFDAGARAVLAQRVRMAWQMRQENNPSEGDVLALEDSLPPIAFLRDAVPPPELPAHRAFSPGKASLKPPSLAAPSVKNLPPQETKVESARLPLASLLDLESTETFKERN